MDLRVEGYYTRTSNYISSEDHEYPAIRYSDNIDRVWTRGAELEFNRSVAAGLGIYFNYNFYIVSWHDDSLKIEPFLMELTPKHRFNARLSYLLLKSTSLSLDAKGAMGRSSKAGLSMDDYYVLGTGIEQQLLNRKFIASLRMENIFGVDYQEIYGYPMPGRTIALYASCYW